jgi:hypothetical protein
MNWLWTWLCLCWTYSPLILVWLIPTVSARPLGSQSFPDITFLNFSNFITSNFGPTISLQAVLIMLFSVLENPDLISLHARQQFKLVRGEQGRTITQWITTFSQLLVARLNQDCGELVGPYNADDQQLGTPIERLSNRVQNLAKLLNRYPYSDTGTHTDITPYSDDAIEPIHIICPSSNECETVTCLPRSLLLYTKSADIGTVRLIKGTKTYSYAYPLSGHCTRCKTIYTADSEHNAQNNFECYLNSAKYLQLGSQIWADRLFCSAVVHGMYSFHASTSAYTDYWNHSYPATSIHNVTRRHIWQAFVQESVRTLAQDTGESVVLPNRLPIEDVPAKAFEILGAGGKIKPGEGHACTECTHPYKNRQDVIPHGVRPQREVRGGIEDNEEQEDEDESGSEREEPREDGQDGQDRAQNMVNMVVVDGIVMGTTVSLILFT